MKKKLINIFLFFSLGASFCSFANTADEFQVWISHDLKVRFTYPSYWRVSPSIHDATIVTINWLGKESGSLIATCYLQKHESSMGGLSKTEIHQHSEEIVDSLLRNIRNRGSHIELILSRKALQDGHPIVYLESKTEIHTFDKTLSMKMYSMVTAWQSKELIFSCGVPSELLIEELGLKEVIEGNVYRIIRSLQFK